MESAELTARVAANVTAVRGTIAEACQRAGRPAESVRLVAVTKYVGLAAIRALLEAGVFELGESRVQQLTRRVEKLGASRAGLMGGEVSASSPRWHMIGHLQRNKVKFLLPDAPIVHSVDSVRLAEALDQIAGREDVLVDVLVEVNVSGEASKFGAEGEGELRAVLAEIQGLRNLRLCGLMTMAPLGPSAEAARPHFARLRELLEALREAGDVGPECEQLSMGMSQDYAVAIEEGATMVRVGSALFEGLSPQQAAAD